MVGLNESGKGLGCVGGGGRLAWLTVLAAADVRPVPTQSPRREVPGWERKTVAVAKGVGAASAQPANAVETTSPVSLAFERAANTAGHCRACVPSSVRKIRKKWHELNHFRRLISK